MGLKTFPLGGVHPAENKLSETKACEIFPVPKKVTIPICQQLGAPSTVLVKKGDTVKVGTLLAKSSGFISANIHSSVSGKVDKIEETVDSTGYRKMAVLIESDGDEWEEDIDRSSELNKEISLSAEEIVQKVLDKGIVGLGGATFPSHVKLMVPKGKKADLLIVNGVECEPYLTSDHRLMLEKGEELLVGISIVMKALKVDKAVIGIENNKKDAISYLEKICSNYQRITVQALKVMYPQGGEKQLIKAITRREVPSGGLPIDAGAVVHNVGTIFAIYEAVQKNKPLVERVVTVTGKSLSKPSNFLVRVGTSAGELIERAGGLPEDTGKVIMGGPMMGKALTTMDVPVVKGTSGILVVPLNESKRKDEGSCIRCSRCAMVCAMGLEPYLLNALSRKSLWERLESEHVMDCIECGCCSFTCPSNLSLLDYIRVGKNQVGKLIRSRKK